MRLLKSKVMLIFLLFVILSSIISRAYLGVLLIPSVLLFHYLIPGLAIQKYCRYLNYNEFNKSLFSSVAVGYALAIVLYIIMLMCGLQRCILIPSVVITIISLLYIWNDIPRLLEQEERDSLFLSFVLLACLGLGFVGFQCQNLSAHIVGEQNMHCDYLYWLRNSVASTMSYPLPNLSVLGNNLFYHYFSSLAIADFSFITGLDLFDSCFTFSYLIRMILVVGSVYIISTEFVNRKYYQYLAILLILFGTTIEELTLTNYIGMIYMGPLGLAEGFAMCLFSYFFFCRITHFNIREMLLPVFLFMVAIGIKAPCALVVLFGILSNCFMHMLCNRKMKVRWFMLILVYLFSFFVMMFFFVWDINPQMSGSATKLQLSISTAFRPPFFASLYSELHHVISFVSVLCVFLLYVIMNYYLFVIVSMLVYKRRRIIDWKHLELALFVMFLCGNGLFLFINHLGFSQVQFYIVSLPFGILFFMSIVEKFDMTDYKRWEMSLIKMTLGGVIICFVYSYVCYIDVEKIDRAFGGRGRSEFISGSSLSSDELIALRWAKDNIDKNAVVVSNKIFAENGWRSYVLSSFVERQVYLEGFLYSAGPNDKIVSHRLDLLKSFFADNYSAQGQLKKEGVTHVFVFKNLLKSTPKVRGINIFENSSVIIYKI